MLVVIVLLHKISRIYLCCYKTFVLAIPTKDRRVKHKMEANKENVRQKIETRIPLPLQPLPSLPMHLLNKKGENIEKRHPLQTIAQTNVFPSTSNARSEQEKPTTKKAKKILDTKYVTIRKKTERLDWQYNIFKDHDEKIIILSDDDEDTDSHNSKEDNFFEGNKDKNFLDERLAITPSEKSVQHQQVRNIKRSLKRPSSRELQGLSPPDKREKRVEERAKRCLVFTESLQDRLQSPDYWIKTYMRCLNKDYTEQLLSHLLIVERPPVNLPVIPRLTRACVINWLMKVNGPLGNPAIIQTACWYLDSILGTGRIQLDKIQLVAVACFWIAQKLHGPVGNSSRLVKCANNAFTQERLLIAERQILLKLGFPPQPVVPHEFITYLAWWCDSDHPCEIEMAASFLCMSGMMVVKELCDTYPSVIACAAIRNAVMLLRRKDLMKRIQDCPLYKAAETKAGNLFHTCAVLRKAVRTVADPHYKFKAPIEYYGGPPHYVAQQIINSARQCFSKPNQEFCF